MAACSVGTAPDRERLIRDCLPDVQARAWEIARTNRWVRVEDLIAEGNLALVKAARRWEPEGGASFRAYAYIVTRGAMLSYLRKHRPLGRHDARRSSTIEHARFRFAAREGRFPGEAELAGELRWTDRELSAAETRVLRAVPLSLEEAVVGPVGNEMSHLADLVAADVDVERDACAQETATELADLIEQLPPREQLVIRWTYWGDRKLREMAAWLGVTESRAHQIRKAALKHLRQLAPELREAA